MKLRMLVADEKWQEFDTAWAESIEAGEPADDLISALEIIGKKKRIPRCLPMLKDHAGKLSELGRAAEAARVLGASLVAGASPGEVGGILMETAEKAWGAETWFELYVQEAGLRGADDLRKAWKMFDKMRCFEAGQVVFHPGGWGTGQIKEVREGDLSVRIKFATGRQDDFPMSAAVDIFQVLPDNDLRAMHLRDKDGVKKKMKEEPLEILRSIVARANGKATMIAIRNAMMQVGVEGTSWTSWWRKTKKLAENSEWFRVAGSGTKTEISLLMSATDPVEDLRRQLRGIRSLEELLARCRELMTGEKVDETLRDLAIETLQREVQDETAPAGVRLAVWLFLFEHTTEVAPELLERMVAASKEPDDPDPSVAPPLWALFQTVPTAREQERCLEMLTHVFGEDAWMDELSKNLQHAPAGMVRHAIEKLSSGGRKEDLAEHYRVLLTRPLRSPHVLTSLARLAETGKLKGEFPPSLQRAQALLSLATYVYINRRTDVLMGRVNTRLTEFLTKGREPILRQMLADADYDGLRSAQTTIQRGVEEVIDNLVGALVIRAAPDDKSGKEGFFWESDSIWSTRKGLNKRQAELKEILDEKIPAAEEAIGKAASYGDLSENAEWTAAIEERRNLSELAGQMKKDLMHVDLIDDAIRLDGVVCPGSFVRYKNSETGEEQRIVILGPWDTDRGDDVVSYRAPLAGGLLGCKVGDSASVELPTGSQKLEVQEVGEAEGI